MSRAYEMSRYDLDYCDGESCECNAKMYSTPDGDWVDFEAAAKRIQDLESTIAEQAERIRELEDAVASLKLTATQCERALQ